MRAARFIVVVVLAALASVYVFAGAPIAVAIFGVAVLHLLTSRSPWLLALQAALVYTACAGLGVSVGALGFLGGALLLSGLWPLTPLVVLSAALLAPSADATITMVLLSLVVYGLGSLVDRVDEMHRTRLALAAAAVAEERLRIAAELNAGLGRGLDAITTGCRAALANPGEAPACSPRSSPPPEPPSPKPAQPPPATAPRRWPPRSRPRGPCWRPPGSRSPPAPATQSRSARRAPCWRRCCARR